MIHRYIYIYIYVDLRPSPQGPRDAHKGPAHRGPGGPICAWPTKAQGGPQGPRPQVPRRGHKGQTNKAQGGPQVCACMHPCIHASIHPCIHASMHPCIHACMQSCNACGGLPLHAPCRPSLPKDLARHFDCVASPKGRSFLEESWIDNLA